MHHFQFFLKGSGKNCVIHSLSCIFVCKLNIYLSILNETSSRLFKLLETFRLQDIMIPETIEVNKYVRRISARQALEALYRIYPNMS